MNRFSRKTGLKNITNAHINRFGPPSSFHLSPPGFGIFFLHTRNSYERFSHGYLRMLFKFFLTVIILNNFSKCNLSKSYIYRQVALAFLFSTLTITFNTCRRWWDRRRSGLHDRAPTLKLQFLKFVKLSVSCYLEETNVGKKFSATCIITIVHEHQGKNLVISTTWDPENYRIWLGIECYKTDEQKMDS